MTQDSHPEEDAALQKVDRPESAATKSGRKVAPRFILNDAANQTEVFCVRFSPDDQYLAAACGNGTIRVYNTSTGKQAFLLGSHVEDLPVTQIRWRPHQSLSKTKNVLISVDADGVIKHWHITSGKCLHEIQ